MTWGNELSAIWAPIRGLAHYDVAHRNDGPEGRRWRLRISDPVYGRSWAARRIPVEESLMENRSPDRTFRFSSIRRPGLMTQAWDEYFQLASQRLATCLTFQRSRRPTVKC
jgi:hypothetical protein